MNLNVTNWKPFKIQRTESQKGLFEIENCKCGSVGELDGGSDINYIGAKKSDNGVMRSVSLDGNANLVSKGHGIMFICDGEGSVGYTNYMDSDFIGSTTTSIGYDDALTETNAMFLVSVLDNEKFKYSYGRKYRKNLINAEIYLPVQHNADGSIFIDDTKKYSDEGYVPDWQFMEDYIKSLRHKPLTTKNRPGQAPALIVQNWGEFTIKQLFPVLVKGKCGDASSLIDGTEINYIGARYNDNGVMKSCAKSENADFISDGNCIAMIGQGQGSAGRAIYLDSDFIGATSLNLGYANWINPYTAHFVTTILCQEYDKYSFGRSWTGDRLKNTIIKLPVDVNGNPDWQFMEDYIKSLRHKPLITKNKPGQAPDLNVQDWGEFKIKDFFNVELAKGDIKLEEVDKGEIPLVSSGESNNGIVGYIDKNGDGKSEMFPANRITLDMFGNAFYQNEPFYAVSHGRVNILNPKFELTRNIGLFVSAIIKQEQYKFSYGRAVYSSVAENMDIVLPIDANGNPDWQFMEDYIKALPYGDRLEG